MEALLPIIIQVIAGVMGGGGIASVLKDANMGSTGNMIAGALGGLGGGSILGMLGAAGTAAGDAAGGGMLGSLISSAVGGGAGGAILTAVAGVLMMANVPYHSFKGIDFKGRVPFVVIFIVVLIFGLVTVDPPSIFLAASLIYAASGPVMQVLKRRKSKA